MFSAPILLPVGPVTGFPMTEARIKAMNEAGLQELQISIDGVTADHVSNWSVVV